MVQMALCVDLYYGSHDCIGDGEFLLLWLFMPCFVRERESFYIH
jgi:hypothetical protein